VLADRLAAQGLTVSRRAATSLSTTAAAYAPVDAVVLDDVSAPALGTARQRALVAAVRDGGLGLFVSGGAGAFSLGHYAGSPLERALPVTSHIPGSQQRRNVALELVIDRSGSMLDEAGGFPKIDEARAAARTATRFAAQHQDELGVVSFDSVPRLLVPFGRIDSAAAAAAATARIDGLTADGGTDIPAAVAAGLRQLETSRTRDRHLILLTDGESQIGSDYSALAARMKREHISLSAVAVGITADRRLSALARATGGAYHVTADAAELPAIFSQEANRAAQPVRVRGRLAVNVGAPSPIVRSLSGTTLPAVRQNVVTTARASAQQTLQIQGRTARRDPGLAQWQYGLGRVAVWTPGVAAAWAGAWAAKGGVWADAVRWAQRPVASPPLSPTVTADLPHRLVVDPAATAGRALDLATLGGSLSNADGANTPLRFAQVAPSRYAATVPGLAPGIHGYAITSDAGPATTRGLVAVPYDPEHLPLPANATPLGTLAATTGGAVRAATDPAALGGGITKLWRWLAGVALLLFAGVAVLRLLGVGSGRGDRDDRPAGPAQSPTSPARRPASNSTSSAGTSVGAGT
jgi:uncharacterized protein YegL